MLKRTKLGFFHAFAVQYDGLRISASLFDMGHRNEAARMANAIFILLGPESKNHTAILQNLPSAHEPWIYSTAARDKGHGSALIAVEATPYTRDDGENGGWIIGAIPFGIESIRSARRISPSDWWGEEVLAGVGETGHLTRLQVVRVIRDQDGGAHLDDHIKDPVYLAVHLRGVGFQYKPTADSEKSVPVEGAIEATIRQMSTEVIESLRSLRITAQVALSEASKSGPVNLKFFEMGSP